MPRDAPVRGPQSEQSEPNVHKWYSEPKPPSSQSLRRGMRCEQELRRIAVVLRAPVVAMRAKVGAHVLLGGLGVGHGLSGRKSLLGDAEGKDGEQRRDHRIS